jgi:cell division protein FtsL
VKTISQELVRLNQNLYQSQNEIAQLREKEAKKGDEISKIQQEMKNWQSAAK